MSVTQDLQTIRDWPQYLSAAVLVMVRVSGLLVFAPIFSSAAIASRVKAGFVIAMTLLLAPAVAVLPGARPVLDASGLLGELAVGLCFGLSLSLLNEAVSFTGTVLGQSFSFSLVNLLDPNTRVETAVIAQMLDWFTILVILAAGLDRTLIAALVRSFSAIPVGRAVFLASSAVALVSMASGIFLAGLQLAAPVIAAALAVEVTVSLVSRLAPQLPAMIVSIPLKTMVSYAVLVASLAVWPGWIEHHFNALLNHASNLLAIHP
jgi:flagellar biosynthetic protein FliR